MDALLAFYLFLTRHATYSNRLEGGRRLCLLARGGGRGFRRSERQGNLVVSAVVAIARSLARNRLAGSPHVSRGKEMMMHLLLDVGYFSDQAKSKMGWARQTDPYPCCGGSRKT